MDPSWPYREVVFLLAGYLASLAIKAELWVNGDGPFSHFYNLSPCPLSLTRREGLNL
jgi:hypothetical protein